MIIIVNPYGYELILDLHGCDTARFNRSSLDGYFVTICNAIEMVRCERYFWDDHDVPTEERQTELHTKGAMHTANSLKPML